MLNGKRIIVVMPAYNAARTLHRTLEEIPREFVDDILVVDDGSSDETVGVSLDLGLTTFVHRKNMGYGRNQKTCYREALKRGADIIVMLHPDYQYSPRLIVPLSGMIAFGEYDVALGSRILGKRARRGAMPRYKYVANRVLTAIQNVFLGQKLSEYHTGFRAFSSTVLRNLPLEENSDDFVFDNQMLAQVTYFGYRIGEVSCPTRYFPEASSINFPRSVKYGFGVLRTCLEFRLQKLRLGRSRIFNEASPKLVEQYYEQVGV